jgi:hypothetical protein
MPFALMSPRAIGRMGSLKRDNAIGLSSGTACLTISEEVRCGVHRTPLAMGMRTPRPHRSRPPVVAGATFAKDDKLGVDLVAPVPTGAKCVTPTYRAAGR